MSLLGELSARVGSAFADLDLEPALGEVTLSDRQDLGQFQCNGALPAAKLAQRNPREIAEQVVSILQEDATFMDVSVAGPGFINLSLTDSALAGSLSAAIDDDRLAVPEVDQSERVIIDYGGYNIAKSLHVGHLRPTIIGDALVHLFRFAGHEVIGDAHLGDWGAPMGMLIEELRLSQPTLPYFGSEYADSYPSEAPVSLRELDEMYPRASNRIQSDETFAAAARQATAELQDGARGYRALWRHFRQVSIDDVRTILSQLGIEFDLWNGESTVHDRIEPLVERLRDRGLARESDGALVVDVQADDDNSEIPPMILLRSDGSFLYTTTDLATIDERVDDLGAERIIYVVDERQSLHFLQVFRAARLGDIVPPGLDLEHTPFGTVNGPDGKPFRTRTGDMPSLQSLIDDAVDAAKARLAESDLGQDYPSNEQEDIARQVGVAAIKFGDLINHRASNYAFDLARFVSFEGKTGPYLQYAAARMKSILRKADAQGLQPGGLVAPSSDAERSLMLMLTRLPDVIDRALEGRAPNHIAEYAYEVATAFNSFYAACHILSEEDRDRQGSWLTLTGLCLRYLTLLLGLLGIEVPERM